MLDQRLWHFIVGAIRGVRWCALSDLPWKEADYPHPAETIFSDS